MVRTSPPSAAANNQDVFIWALYLLGGADSAVDVEAIYLKAFELAPARLGWRTRPDLPDYKKTSKSLQSVEAKTHMGLVFKINSLTRMLTPDGVAWASKYAPLLSETYSQGRVAPTNSGLHQHLRMQVKQSVAFNNYIHSKQINLGEAAQALGCSPASSAEVWAKRLNELWRTAEVLDDQELRGIHSKISEIIRELKG